jgi:hypothetical protein
MYHLLFNILIAVIAINVFAIGALALLLANARIILHRNIRKRQEYFQTIEVSLSAPSSIQAANLLGIEEDAFRTYCMEHRIEIPEDRIARKQEEEQKQQEAQDRILAEEASWRAEQEKNDEERRRSQEAEARSRVERLKRFGFQ